MGRRFITAHDIDDLVAEGRRELRLDEGTRLTDLARERARDHGVALIEVAGTSGTDPTAATAPVTPASPTAPPPAAATRAASAPRPVAAPRPATAAPIPTPAPRTAAPPVTSGEQRAGTGPTGGAPSDDAPPRRQLRAAVRAGVVEEFGTVPAGLDAAIGRVLDRLGVQD